MKNRLRSLLLIWIGAIAPVSLVHADDQVYSVAGLERPAEIIVDEWGVPHIYANTHYDAFFVQGFNAARDRLWQIDTWRRRGLGQLSAVFGEAYLRQDRATRLFLYRGDMPKGIEPMARVVAFKTESGPIAVSLALLREKGKLSIEFDHPRIESLDLELQFTIRD